jgi:hypothetical protein
VCSPPRGNEGGNFSHLGNKVHPRGELLGSKTGLFELRIGSDKHLKIGKIEAMDIEKQSTPLTSALMYIHRYVKLHLQPVNYRAVAASSERR